MPTISNSQIETWQACPMRWKLQSIDKVPQEPQSALLLGTAVHAAIEADTLHVLAGEDPATPEELIKAGHWFLDEQHAQVDPQGHLSSLLPVLHQRLAAILFVYARQVRPKLRPLQVESWLRVTVPEYPAWTFVGRIDALALDEADTRVLVDYKTAERSWLPGREHTLLQASAYLWAAQETGLEVQAIIFLPLSTSPIGREYGARVEFRRTRRTEEERLSYIRLVQTVIDEVEDAADSGVYPARPGKQCRWCSVSRACPAALTSGVA